MMKRAQVSRLEVFFLSKGLYTNKPLQLLHTDIPVIPFSNFQAI